MIFNHLRAKRALEDEDLDGIVALSPESVFYLSNYWASSYVIRDRISICAFFKEANPCLIIVPQDVAWSKEFAWVKDIKSYNEFGKGGAQVYSDPFLALQNAFEERGLRNARIGVEGNALSRVVLNKLTRIPGVKMAVTDSLFKRMRSVKSPDEIARLKQAAISTAAGYETARELARPGMTERTVASEAMAAMIKAGGDGIKFFFMGAGPQCGMVHNVPGDYVLKRRDIIHMDVGATHLGYCGDLAGDVFVGRPEREIRESYEKLVAIQEATIDACKPGVRASEVFQRGIEIAKKVMPEYNRLFVGHGIGLEVHEMPFLAAWDDTVLEPGMVLAIEHRAMTSGTLGGLHIEDMIVVTSHKHERISRLTRDYDAKT